MSIRRVITGHSPAGKSIFVADTAAPRTTAFKHSPGFVTSLLWETPAQATVPASQGDPVVSAKSWVPQPGGTNLMFVTFPPDAVMMSSSFDPAAAGGEYMHVLPGLAEKFEMESPGMHTTDSVDYAVLLDGELHLELDDGATKKLAPRDVVIQNGTRHAWRNKSDRPATMLFVLVGAKRKN
jgi:hypothetical protein